MFALDAFQNTSAPLRPSFQNLQPPCALWNDRCSPSPVPFDIVRRIAVLLHDDGYLRTLASLHVLCKGSYDVVTPVLYSQLHINLKSGELLHLGGVRGEEAVGREVEDLRRDGTFWSTLPDTVTIRRVDAFRYTRCITVHQLPTEAAAGQFSWAAQHAQCILFPNVSCVSFLPDAVDGIRMWSPDSYDRPRNPPLLEGLAKACSPKHACLAFRLVESKDWEEHRDATVAGQYQLVARINRLQTDGWGDIESLTLHAIVHQVLPSLKGCRNVYHFSPHVVLMPATKGWYLFPTGASATGIPGPPWNIRSWQLSTGIKNLFPSCADAQAALKGTSWEFIGVEGHILTKKQRDDDDESGVEWQQAGPLIRDAVRNALPLDLPAREGFGEELVGEVFRKTRYRDLKDVAPCDSCGRRGPSDSLVSPIEHIYADTFSRRLESFLRTPNLFPTGPAAFVPSLMYGDSPH